MEKKQAIQLISDTFNAKFDENKFTLFIKNLLNDIEPKTNRYSGQMLWDDHKDHINKYKRIGKYTDPNGEPLDVLIVEVKTIAKLERARTALRNFVIKHLKNFDKDFALVAFYAKEDDGVDWRFSFIKLEHQSYFDKEKDKVKIKEELTPAKRYSFLVGEYEQSHTAKTQLLPLLQNLANNPTVEDLENAFSIEKVTAEFFEQYKDLFKKLSAHFEKDEHIKAELQKAKIDNARFTKKLLGQIVFLYFLQKKGWLGVPKNEKWGNGDKRFIQNLFDKSNKENYFRDYLQYLFYEALAKERNNENSYYKKFNCRIPFLNGGLFEAEYDWQNANITIPDDLFRSGEEKENDRTGVLDIFDRYNFTIKEDEPLDKEVAVDPEMLGKVFENMLEITERKSKGAFYTPREIVHYMCQESLIHYLDNALDGKVTKTDIETYIRKGHNALENDQRVAKEGKETARYKYILPKSIRQNADLIDQKLTHIKICDPAIGSGAFPVGLLHELVNAQLVIKPHFTAKYLNQKLKEFGFSKKDQPSESRYIYRLKRHIIQESIYGVDIDASAIDIARLRLWLSLVVDEDDFDPIETLPNLDYKIVCGNSLISRYPLDMPIDNVFKEFNKKVQSKDYTNQAIKYLVGNKKIDLAYYKQLTNEFLLESSHEKKEIFRKLIKEIKNAFKTVLGEKDKEKLSKARGAVENLQQSDIFGNPVGTKTQIKNAKKHFTKLKKERQETLDGALYKNAIEWRFEFPNLLDDDGNFVGFDVVIGNPPYVDIKQLPEKMVRFLFKDYISTQNRINLYSIFIERGFNLCSKDGSLVFINPNSMLLNSSYKKLRQQIIKNLVNVIKLPNKVFKEAIVETIIIHISKLTQDNQILGSYYKKNDIINFSALKSMNFERNIWMNDPDVRISIFTTPEQHTLLAKISSNKDELRTEFDFCLGITPYDKYKGHTKEEIKSRVFHSIEKKNNLYVPLISGANVNRYYVNENPIKEYLRYGNWLGAPRQKKYFVEPRVIVRQIISGNPLSIYAGYTEKVLYHTQIGFAILPKENSQLSPKILSSYLCSEVLNFYHKYKYLDIEKNTFQKILIENCKSFPIPKINSFSDLLIRLFTYNNLINRIESKDTIISFFNELNNSVFYELFFPQELKQANKQVLKHLTDLKPIEAEMSEEEKLAIIQSEFERLYHPEHPVRFAVETLDSIEEVRIIKEALR